MIAVRRAPERAHERSRKREVWRSFCLGDGSSPVTDGFGALVGLDEHRLHPGADVPARAPGDAEVLTYVQRGALAYEDSAGGSGIIQAGEFEHLTAARAVRYRERNASRTDSAHLFQIVLHPAEADLASAREQKRFSTAERRGELRIWASPDARRGSLRIHQDALMYSAMLESGQHVVHELAAGRCAWLQLVEGEVSLGDFVLGAGDGAGFTGEQAVSFTARGQAELLLLDLGAALPRIGRIGGLS